jgi:hypothetical protein
MRVSGLVCVAGWVVCLLPITSSAQSTAQRRAAAVTASEEQTEPYHKHRDIRHGHDHYYPDRGAIVRDLPAGTIGTSYAGVSYRYHDGIWLEPHGPAYIVVAPPVGLLAPTLPLYSTVVTHGSDSFLYCNDTYYRPRPDLGGYEVVNDPAMESGPAAPPESEALVGGRMPAAQSPGASAVGAAALAGVGAGAAMGAVPLGSAAVGPMGATAVPVAAREAMPVAAPEAAAREPSLSGGTMPGANTGPGAASGAAIPGATAPSGSFVVATPSSATPSSGAAAASVPAASLGASAGASAPAAPAGTAAPGTQKVPKVFLYPKNGQSADQQARDRYDCYRFAVAQSGFDPMRTAGSAPGPAAEQQSDFDRAQGACFEGRGYSNR